MGDTNLLMCADSSMETQRIQKNGTCHRSHVTSANSHSWLAGFPIQTCLHLGTRPTAEQLAHRGPVPPWNTLLNVVLP